MDCLSYSGPDKISPSVALPMSPTRVDIGAVVVIDPVPINYLHSASCRRRILDKYVAPLSDALRWQKAKAAGKKKKKATTATTSAPSTEYAPDIKFLERIQTKGPMGEYLIDLAESALEPTGGGGGGGVISISTEDYDLVMRNAQDTLSLEEEINYYEEAISTKMRESISDNRRAAISRSGRKPLYSALAEGVLHDMVTDNKAILGCFPSRSSEVALAMKDRMLVLSCCEGGEEEGDANLSRREGGDDDDAGMVLDGGGSTVGSGSVWDSRAVEELAQLYQATPVIQLPYATDMYDDFEDDDDDDSAAKRARPLMTLDGQKRTNTDISSWRRRSPIGCTC